MVRGLSKARGLFWLNPRWSAAKTSLCMNKLESAWYMQLAKIHGLNLLSGFSLQRAQEQIPIYTVSVSPELVWEHLISIISRPYNISYICKVWN